MSRHEIEMVNRIIGLIIVAIVLFGLAQIAPRSEVKGLKVYGNQERNVEKPYFEIGR